MIFVALLILVGCSKKEVEMQTPITTTPGPHDSSISPHNGIYLALGDSYTIGQSVDSAQRFPAQAAALVNADSIHINGIQYIAASGWTTLNLQNAINIINPQGPYVAVSLLIGVNDQYQRRDTVGYRQQFLQLLTTAVRLAGYNNNHVFVLSIPDYGVTPFGQQMIGTSQQIDQFNAINKQVTDALGISYTDVTGISRNNAGNNAMLSPDGLHPSGAQYAQWAAALAPVMKKALQ